MNQTRKLSFNLVLATGLVLSLFFLVIVVKKFDLTSFSDSVKGISPSWLLLAIAIYFFAFGFRAVRCQIIQGVAHPITIVGFLQALFVGCCLNGILPCRLGEVGRVMFLHARENLDPAIGAANLTTERLLDVFSLGLTGLLLVYLLRDQAWLNSRREYLYLILLACVVAILFGRWLVKRTSSNSPIGHGDAENYAPGRILAILARFASGMNNFNRPGKFLIALGFSFSAIVFEGLSYHFLMSAMGIHLPVTTGILLFIAISFSALLPSAPGSLGILQFTATFVLRQNGIPDNIGLNFAIVLTVLLYLPAVLGMIALVTSGSLSLREVWMNQRAQPGGLNVGEDS